MKLKIFIAAMTVATTAMANSDVEEMNQLASAWSPKCESVTHKTQLLISSLYSVSQDAVSVTISKAFRAEGQPFIAVGAEVRVGRGICTLAWKTDLDSCVRELDYLTCNQR